MTLHLYSFQPDVPGLMRLAAREGLLPPGDDPGYAIHAILAASFGPLAPKPWALLTPGQGGGPRGRLLGYGEAPLEALLQHTATYADPAFMAPLALESAAGRLMPTRFAPDARLGFRVRLRPVARSGKDLPRHLNATGRRARERDVFLSRIDAAHVAVGTVSEQQDRRLDGSAASAVIDGGLSLSRAACYLDWLDKRLQTQGAALVRLPASRVDEEPAWDAQVQELRFTRLMSRDRSNRGSRPRAVNGPDAVVTGTLVVRDPESFAAGLARGLGRFRSFGFGMLLLQPPRR